MKLAFKNIPRYSKGVKIEKGHHSQISIYLINISE